MNGERRRIRLAGGIVAALLMITVLWLFLPVSAPKTDEAKFQRWKQTARLFGRVNWWERQLPPILVQQLNLRSLDQKYLNEHWSLEEALTDSGYLTNLSIAVTNAPLNGVMCSNVVEEMRKAFKSRDEWALSVRGNAFVIRCRPQDVGLCSRAIAAADQVSTNATSGVGSPRSPN